MSPLTRTTASTSLSQNLTPLYSKFIVRATIHRSPQRTYPLASTDGCHPCHRTKHHSTKPPTVTHNDNNTIETYIGLTENDFKTRYRNDTASIRHAKHRNSTEPDLPFQDNDSVMADKGFTVQDLLPLGVSLNIPPFLGSPSQMPADDVIRTQEIASLRIHVERAINKIKNFHVWDGVIPLHQFGIVNQMWTVCALLVNAQSNITPFVYHLGKTSNHLH